jgi:hypothetical protein
LEKNIDSGHGRAVYVKNQEIHSIAVQIDLAKTVAAQPAAAFATVAATAAGLDPRPCGGLIGPVTGGAENQGKSCRRCSRKIRNVNQVQGD